MTKCIKCLNNDIKKYEAQFPTTMYEKKRCESCGQLLYINIIKMNEKYKAGEEGVLEQASYLLENKGVDFIFISRKTKKKYKLKLVEDDSVYNK